MDAATCNPRFRKPVLYPIEPSGRSVEWELYSEPGKMQLRASGELSPEILRTEKLLAGGEKAEKAQNSLAH